MEEHDIIAQVHDCINLDDAQALEEILQSGRFDVNQPVDFFVGETILFCIVFKEKRNCFNYLLTVPELQLDWQDSCGGTPLMQATLVGNSYYVERLLEKGADSSLCDSSGDTPLHLTDSVEICQLLIDHGCDINHLNDNGWSALHTAVTRRSFELCYMLLYHGIDATIADDLGQTALSLAILKKLDNEFIEVLALYTYDHIKEPIPLMLFIAVINKRDRFIFDQLLDSCSEVFYTAKFELYRFIIDILSFDVEMLVEFFKRKPIVLTKIFKDCVSHFRYSLKLNRLVNTSKVIDVEVCFPCVEFLENSSLSKYFYNTLTLKMHLPYYSVTENLTTLIYILLSQGFILPFKFIASVYNRMGDCNLFRDLLYFDSDISLETTLEDFGECLGDMSPMIPLILQPRVTLTQCLIIYGSFDIVFRDNVVPLFDYFALRGLQDFCWTKFEHDEEVKARLVQMPTVPKLLELARDVTRQHIIQTFHCTKVSMFYCYIKHLPISNVYKDILTYKTKIY